MDLQPQLLEPSCRMRAQPCCSTDQVIVLDGIKGSRRKTSLSRKTAESRCCRARTHPAPENDRELLVVTRGSSSRARVALLLNCKAVPSKIWMLHARRCRLAPMKNRGDRLFAKHRTLCWRQASAGAFMVRMLVSAAASRVRPEPCAFRHHLVAESSVDKWPSDLEREALPEPHFALGAGKVEN